MIIEYIRYTIPFVKEIAELPYPFYDDCEE